MRENNNISVPSVVSAIALFVCIVLRGLCLIFNWGHAGNYAFYALIGVTVAAVAYRSFKQKEYKKASELKNDLKPYAVGAAIGFILEFINCVITACVIAESEHKSYIALIALIIGGVFALLSSLYMIAVSLSCGKTSYDFRTLRFLHLAPLLWAIAELVYLIPNAPNFKSDVFSVLKICALIFGILFFYMFIVELENENGAKPQTVFVSKAFAYFALLLFFSRAFEVMSKNAQLAADESLFALSILLIGLFAHYYRRELTNI